MQFSKSTQKAYFAFYNKPDGINADGSGEILTHFVAKTALLNLSKSHSVIQENRNVKHINEQLLQELDIAKEKYIKLSKENEQFSELNYTYKYFLVLLWNKIKLKIKK